MTADEIRTKLETAKDAVIRHDDWTLWALVEIAAQLAELNENMRAGMPDANMPDECREKKCSYFKHYLAYGPADLTHKGFHAAEQNGLEHFKDCSRAAKGDNCTVCASYERRLRA